MNKSIFLIIIIMASIWLILDAFAGPKHLLDRVSAAIVPATVGG